MVGLVPDWRYSFEDQSFHSGGGASWREVYYASGVSPPEPSPRHIIPDPFERRPRPRRPLLDSERKGIADKLNFALIFGGIDNPKALRNLRYRLEEEARSRYV